MDSRGDQDRGIGRHGGVHATQTTTVRATPPSRVAADLRVGRFLGLLAALALACSGNPPHPVDLVLGQDACASCRMVVGDGRLASQLVAPGEEPLVFDDLGCLRDYLAAHPAKPGGVVFVADHRTGQWVRAQGAVFTHVPDLATPMGSDFLAHADAASRDLDPAAAHGTVLPAAAIFGPAGAPGGTR